MAQVIQAAWAEAGIELEILPGDNKQTLTKYRARTHDIYIGRWGPDYQDPHTNADTFASNPDNADGAPYRRQARLAQRLGDPGADRQDRGRGARARPGPSGRRCTRSCSASSRRTSPFVIMFQDIEVIAERANVEGMIWGPSFDDNKYWKGHKE